MLNVTPLNTAHSRFRGFTSVFLSEIGFLIMHNMKSSGIYEFIVLS